MSPCSFMNTDIYCSSRFGGEIIASQKNLSGQPPASRLYYFTMATNDYKGDNYFKLLEDHC